MERKTNITRTAMEYSIRRKRKRGRPVTSWQNQIHEEHREIQECH